MRKTLAQQLGLVPCSIPHPHARDLARASAILDLLPEAAELVAKDLVKGTKGTKAGRMGMSGEQVLRAALLKQMHGWSYYDLAFALADSPTFRTFCRIGLMDRAPKAHSRHAAPNCQPPLRRLLKLCAADRRA